MQRDVGVPGQSRVMGCVLPNNVAGADEGNDSDYSVHNVSVPDSVPDSVNSVDDGAVDVGIPSSSMG